MDPSEDETRPRSRLGLLLPVLAVGWLVATPLLAFEAVGHSLAFFGELATTDELLATERGLQITAGVALLIAAVGLCLSVRVRSVAGGIVFALLLVVSLGVAAVSAYWTHELHVNDPAPRPTSTRPPACQEYSGSDNRCPGG